ncbi:similar to An02g08790 [Aspergillus luchuensis]|uniref:Similar to An02g08790 n=1 Tax=Aspergillus kawachii TaxID=1069201 RepID=A0A146FCQ5_ASPKA|nr:similar to An02g08790 [Aspergillus luchuensis]
MNDIRERSTFARGRRSGDRKDIFNRFSWDERAVHESAHGTLAVPERNAHIFRAEPARSGEVIVVRNAAAHNNDNVIPSPDTFPRVLPLSQDEPQNINSNIWTPSSTKDTTIHYEMDIVEDVGSLLEEFSRLKRLGNFQEAEQYFQVSLSAFMDLSPVTIEFADMLVEQGSYRRLHRVLLQHQQQELSTSDGISSLQEGSPAKFLYQANLHLLRDFAFIQSHGFLDEAYGTVRSLERQMRSLRRRRRKDPNRDLDSAEVRVSQESSREKSNTKSIGSVLVTEGRIWDVRDLMLASIQAEGAANTWNLIFGAELGSSNEPFRKLMDDWCLHRYDESTYLAILDILVSLSRSLSSWSISIPERQDLLTAQRCLQYAQALATCLKENNPQLVKSRPYLQWVLAEAELERKLLLNASDLRDHLDKYPGLTIWRNCIPIYLPIKTENPKWTAHLDAGRNYDLLETVLQTAQDLHDYRTEVLCLGELIYRSVHTSERLARLSDVQKTIQGDHLGYRQTFLSGFLLADSEQDCKLLLDGLRKIRESKRSSKSIYSLSDWCAIVIERAVAQRLAEDLSRSDEAFQDTKEGFSTYLPQYIKDRLEALGLDKVYLTPSRTGKPHDPEIRQRSITDVPTSKQDTPPPVPFESLSDEEHGQSKSLFPLQRPGRTYTGSGESDSDDDEYTTDSSFDTARSDDGWLDDEQGHSTSLVRRTQRFGPSE